MQSPKRMVVLYTGMSLILLNRARRDGPRQARIPRAIPACLPQLMPSSINRTERAIDGSPCLEGRVTDCGGQTTPSRERCAPRSHATGDRRVRFTFRNFGTPSFDEVPSADLGICLGEIIFDDPSRSDTSLAKCPATPQRRCSQQCTSCQKPLLWST